MLDVFFAKDLRCYMPDCEFGTPVTHVIFFRDQEDHDSITCCYSCSSCLYDNLTSVGMPVEDVISVKKRSIGVLRWVKFKKDWMPLSRWCEYNQKKLIWDDPAPWEDASGEVLITNLLSDNSTRERIIKYLEDSRLASKTPNLLSICKTPPQSNALELDYKIKTDFTDFTIRIGSREFYVHRVILASSSEYFTALMTNNLKEKAEACVELGDVDPDTFDAYLSFVYHRKLKIDMDNADGLLALSDRFGDSELAAACASFLSKQILEPAIYDLALRYNLEGLQKMILSRIAPSRDLNEGLANRTFQAMPETFEDYGSMSAPMLEGLLRTKVQEMDETTRKVSQYVRHCSSILDDRLAKVENGEFLDPTDITMSIKDVQEIKALLMHIAASTSCSDTHLSILGQAVGTVGKISSRALSCGPCSIQSCRKKSLGQRDYWRIDPDLMTDVPGEYMCGGCYKIAAERGTKKRKLPDDADDWVSGELYDTDRG